MSLLQKVLGNATDFSIEQATEEAKSVLLEGEQVVKAFSLVRDRLIFTNFRVISIDKQGLSGSKQLFTSIPYKCIRSFSKQSAGLMDLNVELAVSLTGGETEKWTFAKGAEIDDAYLIISYYVLSS